MRAKWKCRQENRICQCYFWRAFVSWKANWIIIIIILVTVGAWKRGEHICSKETASSVATAARVTAFVWDFLFLRIDNKSLLRIWFYQCGCGIRRFSSRCDIRNWSFSRLFICCCSLLDLLRPVDYLCFLFVVRTRRWLFFGKNWDNCCNWFGYSNLLERIISVQRVNWIRVRRSSK